MNKPLLTKKKTAWAKQFKPQVLTGSVIHVNAGVRDWYTNELERLVTSMTKAIAKELPRALDLLPEKSAFSGSSDSFSQDASPRMTLNELKRRFLSLFSQKATGLAADLTRKTNRATASSVKASLKELSGGLEIPINTISQELQLAIKIRISESTRLIKSIAVEHLEKVEAEVMHSFEHGEGVQGIMQRLQKINGVTKRRARLIAHDQVNKMHATFTEHRMKSAGIKKFKWLHSGGSRVPRDFHKNVLNGQVFRLDDPPIIDQKTQERGLPGQLYGCTCRMLPIIEFEQGEVQ